MLHGIKRATTREALGGVRLFHGRQSARLCCLFSLPRLQTLLPGYDGEQERGRKQSRRIFDLLFRIRVVLKLLLPRFSRSTQLYGHNRHDDIHDHANRPTPRSVNDEPLNGEVALFALS